MLMFVIVITTFPCRFLAKPYSCLFISLILGTCSFICQDRSGESEGAVSVFESSCHLLLPVLPFKGRSNPVKYLDQGHNKRTSWPVFTLFLNAERQAVKLMV